MPRIYEEVKTFLENFVPNDSNIEADLQTVLERKYSILSFDRRDYLFETYPDISAEEHLHRLSDMIKLDDSLMADLQRLISILEFRQLVRIADKIPSCFDSDVHVSSRIMFCDEEMDDEDDEEYMKMQEERLKHILSILDSVKSEDIPDIILSVEVSHPDFDFTLHIEPEWDNTFLIILEEWNFPSEDIDDDDFLSEIGEVNVCDGLVGLAAGIQRGIDFLKD